MPAIVEIIREKDILARSYNWGGADEKCLLIVARALTLADAGVLSEDMLPAVGTFGSSLVFSEVYFWDCFSEKIWEVLPRGRIVFDCGSRTLYASRLPAGLRPSD